MDVARNRQMIEAFSCLQCYVRRGYATWLAVWPRAYLAVFYLCTFFLGTVKLQRAGSCVTVLSEPSGSLDLEEPFG